MKSGTTVGVSRPIVLPQLAGHPQPHLQCPWSLLRQSPKWAFPTSGGILSTAVSWKQPYHWDVMVLGLVAQPSPSPLPPLNQHFNAQP